MPRYRHPRVTDPGDGFRGFAVDLGGARVLVEPDGTFEASGDDAVRALADAHDTTPEALRVDGDADADAEDDADADGTTGTCDVVKGDGEVCGRDRPCPYHDD